MVVDNTARDSYGGFVMTQKFQEIVGQTKALSRIDMYLRPYERTHYYPSSLLVAPRGYGKTTLAKAIGKHLPLFDEKGNMVMTKDAKSGKMKPQHKPFYKINASMVRTLTNFIEGPLMHQIHDKDITVLVDECHNMDFRWQNAMLDVIEPAAKRTELRTASGLVFNFDFTRQTFLFATTEPQHLFHAFMSRLLRIDLEEYTADEMGEILRREARKANDKLSIPDSLVKEIVPTLRGAPRQAEHMARDIDTFLNGRTALTSKDWEGLKKTLGIFPEGLNDTEVRILRFLNERGGRLTPLRRIASYTGLTEDSISKDFERYLQKLGFMEVEKGGRAITQTGRAYINMIDGKPAKKQVTFRSNNVAS